MGTLDSWDSQRSGAEMGDSRCAVSYQPAAGYRGMNGGLSHRSVNGPVPSSWTNPAKTHAGQRAPALTCPCRMAWAAQACAGMGEVRMKLTRPTPFAPLLGQAVVGGAPQGCCTTQYAPPVQTFILLVV